MRAKHTVSDICKKALAGLFRAACTPLKPLQRSDVLLMSTHLAFPGLRDRLLPAIKPESYNQLSFSKVSGRIEKVTSLSCTATEVQRCSGCQSISSFPSTGVPRPARHCLFIPRPICKVSSVQWIESQVRVRIPAFISFALPAHRQRDLSAQQASIQSMLRQLPLGF